MKRMKRMSRFAIVAIFILVMVLLACLLVACGDNGGDTKQVPVYKGMTISRSFAKASAMSASDDNGNHYGHFKGDHNNRDDEVDQNKPFEDPNAPSIENKANSTLDVVGAAESIYYADKNQDIFITIRLSNPDSYEILSFTLNGKKYSNYMFEDGSDMENLVLKVNVGDVGGIHDYTIDAIKYVDGTDIKDVRMDGDRTVEAGVRADDQTYVNVTNEQKTMTSISFDAQVVDLYSLIEKSGGYAKAVLYDGVNMLTKDINVGEKTNIVFDNLTPNTVYQYGVVALYDNLSGNGAKLNTLYKKAVYTDTIVLFKDVQVGKESIEWGFLWNESFANKQMSAISLWQNDEKVQDVDTGATRIDGLKSNNKYTLKATYKNLQNQDETIAIEFVTYAKAVPTIEIANVQSTQTEITFELNVTDTDNVGAIAKIELLHGDDDPIVSENAARSFANLLSNNDYTIKVTYSYDLNDGVGEQQIVKTANIKTKAKAAPMVEIVNVQSTQTAITFELNVTDTDNVGAITKIELLHGDDEPILASDLTSRSFERLLSNNDYTIQVTYVYDLNDGVGEQTLTDTVEFRTEAKATPTVTISDVDSTQTSVGFVINVTDTDNVGAITKIELLHGNDEPIVADTSDVRTVENLLSNNDYTIQVTYTYDLNDGVGEQQIVKTADIKTKAKAAPTVEILNVQSTQTSISFELNVTDTDDVGAISKIELLHSNDEPIVADTSDVRTFENLLSNNNYTIKVTYTYDLNDGAGNRNIVKTADFKTLEKAAPSVEIGNWTNTQNKLSADVTYTDVDVVGRIESVVLFKGETQVATTNERTHVVFDALEGDTEYTLVVTYKYNLNDGKGEQTATQSAKRYTSPLFEFVEATCANTSAVSKGDIIYFEAVINNPSGVTVEQVKINDQYYAPSAGTTKNSIIVRITVKDQFEGGNTDLVVTEIKGTLHGQDLSINLTENNKASVFVNGELNVKSISIVDEDGNECEMVVANKTYYYKIEIYNKTGYSIKSATIQDDRFPEPRVYNKADNKIIQTQNDYFLVPFIPWLDNSNPMGAVTIKKIEYGNEYLGEKIKDINGVSSEMFVAVENEGAIIVSTPEDLKNMNEPRYYVLQNDIDLKGMEWIAPSDFKGYFDGQGHVIKNISFVGTIENTESNLGLFKNVTGYIKNLRLTGRIIVTARNSRVNIGGLCSMATRGCIKNVFNYIDISVLCENDEDKYRGVSIGGIAAQFYGNIINCANFGTLYSNGNGASVAGLSQGGCLRIRNSFNKGNITGYFCGGLVSMTGDNSEIVDSFNSGDINARWNAGGLLWNDDDKQIVIKNSYSTGVVKADQYSGDLIAGGSPLIENSYYTASNDNRFGEQKTLAEIIEIMRAIWDNNIWDFDNLDENGNPTLKK